VTVGKLTDPVVESESDLTRDRPLDRIQRSAAGASAIGGVAGGLVAGLTTLAFPAFSGAVVLVGMAAGASDGVVSGGLLSNERLPASSAAFIHIAMIRLMLRRLA
jgi:hypothetical protein